MNTSCSVFLVVLVSWQFANWNVLNIMAHWIVRYAVAPIGIGLGNFILVSWLFERTLKCSYFPKHCGLYPIIEENIFFTLAFPTRHFESVFSTFFEAALFNAIFWTLVTSVLIFFWTKFSSKVGVLRTLLKKKSNE